MKEWKGKWIWMEGEERPRNFFVYFRRKFYLSFAGENRERAGEAEKIEKAGKAEEIGRAQRVEKVQKAILRISADSRYVLYLNGERLGQGPARAFPEHQQYDFYEVGARLNKGENVIAILVHHFGEGNFQYIEGRAGLLCQLDIETKERERKQILSIGSDKEWRVKECLAFSRDVPRISVQQAFEEQYDANKEIEGWKEIDFDDSHWERAKEIGKAGCLPWKKLEARTIPFLSEEPVYAKRIISQEIVQSIPYQFSFNLSSMLFPGKIDANRKQINAFLFTSVYTHRATKMGIYPFSPFYGVSEKRLKVNGMPIEGSSAPGQEINLKKGWNALLFDLSGSYFHLEFSFAIDSKEGLLFSAYKSRNKKSGWVTLGNFSSQEDPLFKQIWKKGEMRLKGLAQELPQNLVKEIQTKDIIPVDVFMHSTTDRPIKNRKPVIENPDALCMANLEKTIIHQNPWGDTRILIDFGREIVGYLKFAIEAEKGIILDFNMFEAIEDGKIHFTYGLNNTLRYITREGRQIYRSYVRHGFRYLYLTVRNNKKSPLKIANLYCLLNTYPVIEKGAFHSSDAQLNKIWEVGKYTLRLCMEDTYVDCPAYEQAHWVGDARNEALINYACFGAWDISRHCLLQVAHSLEYNILPESHVPSGWRNILPAWSFLWVWAVYEYYQYTADKEFLKEIFPALEKTAQHIDKLRTKRGLFSIKAWNMLDWAAMDTPEEGEITHNNMLAVKALYCLSWIGHILNKDRDERTFCRLLLEINEAINKYCWDEKKKAYVDCLRKDGSQSTVISQQTNTMAYLCNCAQGKRLRLASSYIDRAKKKMVKVGSPFFMFFTLEALAKQGRLDRLVEIIKEKWGFMLDKGATTFWETFPGFDRNWWTRSHCHAWSSAPTYFLSTKILGILPLEPGFKKALIAPYPAHLKWCEGRVPTPRGEIEVSWKIQQHKFNLEVNLPRKMKAEIRLPFPKERTSLMLNGKPINLFYPPRAIKIFKNNK